MKFELRNPIHIKREREYELPSPSGGRVREKDSYVDAISILDSDRKDPVLLENMWAKEPILISGTSTWQLLIEDADWEIFVEDERTQEAIDEILQYTTLREELNEKLPMHFGIFGSHWLEYIKDKPRKKIVEFISQDPKQMMYNGFIKCEDNPNQVAINNLGRPLGYIRTLGSGLETNYYAPYDMSYRYYQQITHTQLGYGFVEALYMDTELKENIEQARGQAAFNVAWPKPIVGYGQVAFGRPTAEQKKEAEALAKQLANPDIEWVTYPMTDYKIDYPIKSELSSPIIDQLIYTTKLQAAVMRIPFAILLQTGEGEGRATLETLVDFFSYSFRGFQRKIKPHLIVKDVIDFNCKSDPSWKPKWKGLRTEYGVLTDKAKKEFVMSIMRMGKTELIDKNDPEIQRLVRKALGAKDSIQRQRVAKVDERVVEQEYDLAEGVVDDSKY